MTVQGVGSKDYFEKRDKATLAIEAIGKKGKAVANEIDKEKLSYKGIVALIGKAFREFVEYFQEGRYQKKLNKRITALKDPKFDDFNKRIDEFHSQFVEEIRAKAFKSFKNGLSNFITISEDLLAEQDFEQAYPELHAQLTIACGDNKTSSCDALTKLPKLLNSTIINSPTSKIDNTILQLQQEFESETEFYLEQNLKNIQTGLNIKSNADNAFLLGDFLKGSKSEHLASLIPRIKDWKEQMKSQRKKLLQALPNNTDNLLLYSFYSTQIRKVKQIIKKQSKEVESQSKLKNSLVHFVADNLASKVKSDRDLIEMARNHIFDKFEKRKLQLEQDKEKTSQTLQKAQTSNKVEKSKCAQKRLDEIQASQIFNDECLDILDDCFETWIRSIQNNTISNEKKLNRLIIKDAKLEKYAKLHHKTYQYLEEAQDAIDAMIADASYRIYYIGVENKTDPRPLPEDATDQQKKDLITQAKCCIGEINDLQQKCFDPLKKKLFSEQQHHPHWVECVHEMINKCVPVLNKLSVGYTDLIGTVSLDNEA